MDARAGTVNDTEHSTACEAKHGTESEAGRRLTVIVLTFDEEQHIERCIRSLTGVASRIVIVDSCSTDRTQELARALGAEVVERAWPGNQAAQFNYALDHLEIDTPWTMRLDADEYLTEPLRLEMGAALDGAPAEVSGFVLRRLVLFQGRPVRHGGFYPQRLLRVWRTGRGRSEARLMDEHLVVDGGRLVTLRSDLVDHNLNDISWWTDKHNRYARREATSLIALRYGLGSAHTSTGKTAPTAAVTRWVKEHVYQRLPLGLRALLYFNYRFFVKLGFLDHPRVWVFHFLQAAWYRTLVDVNVREFEDAVGASSSEGQRAFLKEKWGIEL